MQSITFTTDLGTEVEVRQIDNAIVAEVVQSAALLVDSIEGALEDQVSVEGKVFISPLRSGGVMSIIFPPAPAVENEIENTEGFQGIATNEEVPDGYYVCEHCGNLHPIDPSQVA